MKEFESLGELALHLGEVMVEVHEADHVALERCAKIVEKRAKQKIGEYQDQIGPFIAWPELADSTKADRVRQGYSEDEPGLRSGEMRDSIEHNVADGEARVGSNDDKLVYFELGTWKQPPRSVLGAAAVEKLPEIMQVVGDVAVAALVGHAVHGGRMELEADDGSV